MKAKAEYIKVTTKALEDSRDLGKRELKNFKILPESNDFSVFFDDLQNLLAEIEKIPANDLAFLKIKRPL